MEKIMSDKKEETKLKELDYFKDFEKKHGRKPNSTYELLASIDCTGKIEKKKFGATELTYLSWAWAWDTLKKIYPNSTYNKILFGDPERNNFIKSHVYPCTFDENGWAFVMVDVTVEGHTITEMLNVMNSSNRPVRNPNSFEINTALQRCMVKCIAMHGLGNYIYRGEDIPNPDLETDDGWDFAKKTLLTFLDDCKTYADTKNYWKTNEKSINKIKNNAPQVYEDILHEFKEYANKLKQSEENNNGK